MSRVWSATSTPSRKYASKSAVASASCTEAPCSCKTSHRSRCAVMVLTATARSSRYSIPSLAPIRVISVTIASACSEPNISTTVSISGRGSPGASGISWYGRWTSSTSGSAPVTSASTCTGWRRPPPAAARATGPPWPGPRRCARPCRHAALLAAELTITAGARFRDQFEGSAALPARTGVERWAHPGGGGAAAGVRDPGAARPRRAAAGGLPRLRRGHRRRPRPPHRPSPRYRVKTAFQPWQPAACFSAAASSTHVTTPRVACSTSLSDGNEGASRIVASRGSRP